MIITINGKSHIKESLGNICYEEVLVYAGYKPDRIISVTYRTKRSGDCQRNGILSPGESTEVEEGMVFNAYDTSNS
jgi:hypothetical protein